MVSKKGYPTKGYAMDYSKKFKEDSNYPEKFTDEEFHRMFVYNAQKFGAYVSKHTFKKNCKPEKSGYPFKSPWCDFRTEKNLDEFFSFLEKKIRAATPIHSIYFISDIIKAVQIKLKEAKSESKIYKKIIDHGYSIGAEVENILMKEIDLFRYDFHRFVQDIVEIIQKEENKRLEIESVVKTLTSLGKTQKLICESGEMYKKIIAQLLDHLDSLCSSLDELS